MLPVLDVPLTDTNKMVQDPLLWQMEMLVLPAVSPLTTAKLPLIWTEATAGLLLVEA